MQFAVGRVCQRISRLGGTAKHESFLFGCRECYWAAWSLNLSQWMPTLWTAFALQLYLKTPLLSLLGKCKILLAVFMTLLKCPRCCSTPFNVIGITSEVFNEAKCYMLWSSKWENLCGRVCQCRNTQAIPASAMPWWSILHGVVTSGLEKVTWVPQSIVYQLGFQASWSTRTTWSAKSRAGFNKDGIV